MIQFISVIYYLCSVDIKRYDKESAPQSDEIRIACVSMNSDLRTVINDYKLAHPDIRVKIKSYMDDYKDTSDMYAAIDRDIIDNVNYDIWILSGLAVNKYSSKGLFEDLMPYIENDSSFDLSRYYERALLSQKKDGRLYVMDAARGSNIFVGSVDYEVYYDAYKKEGEIVALIHRQDFDEKTNESYLTGVVDKKGILFTMEDDGAVFRTFPTIW